MGYSQIEKQKNPDKKEKKYLFISKHVVNMFENLLSRSSELKSQFFTDYIMKKKISCVMFRRCDERFQE